MSRKIRKRWQSWQMNKLTSMFDFSLVNVWILPRKNLLFLLLLHTHTHTYEHTHTNTHTHATHKHTHTPHTQTHSHTHMYIVLVTIISTLLFFCNIFWNGRKYLNLYKVIVLSISVPYQSWVVNRRKLFHIINWNGRQ